MTADLQKIETIFLDFDRTMVLDDGWEVLSRVVLERKEGDDLAETKKELDEVAELIAMGSSASFFEVLQRRINLLSATRDDFAKTATLLLDMIAPNLADAVSQLQAKGKTVRIVTGSVKELVEPVAEKVGIPLDHIDSNELDFDGDVCVAAEMSNPLTQDGGKQYTISGLGDAATFAIVGDGPDDLECKTMGGVSAFICFTGAVKNDEATGGADHVIGDFADLPGLFG